MPPIFENKIGNDPHRLLASTVFQAHESLNPICRKLLNSVRKRNELEPKRLW